MYNLLEHSDNYQDSAGSLYQFKRDEPPYDNANVANDTTSLVYKSKRISGTDDNNKITCKALRSKELGSAVGPAVRSK